MTFMCAWRSPFGEGTVLVQIRESDIMILLKDVLSSGIGKFGRFPNSYQIPTNLLILNICHNVTKIQWFLILLS